MTVTPERILDTRDPNNICCLAKLKVTGSIPTATGTKTVVPTGATGVLLNVTPVDPTAAGFISIRPGDATGAATTSSLNFTTGVAGIVPNAVQVAVPTAGANAGQIDITYDAYGQASPTTDILIDVVGYMTSTGLQELVADVATKANTSQLPIARSSDTDDVIEPANASTDFIGLSTQITVPTSGTLLINAGVFISSDAVAGTHECTLSSGSGVTNQPVGVLDRTDRREYVNVSTLGHCHTNGALTVTAGTYTINLVLNGPAASSVYDDANLDVVFYPSGQLTSAATLETGTEGEERS